MRIVLDTNVLVSGIYFRGPPFAILDGWRRRRVELMFSPAIRQEYHATATHLAARFGGVDLAPWLTMLDARATLVDAPALGEQVCTDAADDKFLACAMAGRCRTVVSGDRALLQVSGWRGITVLTPRQFVDRHLTRS